MIQGNFLCSLGSSVYSLEERENHLKAEGGNSYCDVVIEEEDDEEAKAFWEEPVPYTPEARLEAHRFLEERKNAKENRLFVILAARFLN